MAIDKSSAPPWVKIIIILVAISFVVSMGVPFIATLFEPTSSPSTATGTQGSTTATDTAATIAAKYAEKTRATDEALKADPKNYDLLLAQAQTYQDWAGEIVTAAAGQSGGADRPLWLLSVDFYRRALAVKPGDPNVETDYSIAVFYSGDTTGAIEAAQKVAKANPKFAPVQFNMGVFYTYSGDRASAIAAYEKYLKLDPQGELVSEAKTRLTELRSAPAASTGTSLAP